ncbi:unnamed protein product [Symbiodinium sp. CCMP2456]|nr:unnamed protein product [Symbiodinium sp. CCMP2456]
MASEGMLTLFSAQARSKLQLYVTVTSAVGVAAKSSAARLPAWCVVSKRPCDGCCASRSLRAYGCG